jgi:hypothetical protein
MLPKNFRVLELEPNIIVSCDNIIFNWLSVSPISLMIERSSDAVCGLHHAQGDEEREFLGLDSKPRSTVFPSLASKPVAMVLVVWHQNHSLTFPSLGLKTGSCGLLIWPTKSPQRFLGLSLKTKWVVIYRLRHKTERRMKMAWDMH